MRILRIFKMVRHFVGLQSLVYTLHQAYKDLGLILIIVAVTVLMFSSLVYAFEQESKILMSSADVKWWYCLGDDTEHWSFYDCIWWGLMTLTTVGYHIQPQTFLAKLSCGLCALCGVFIITLPIPIGKTYSSCTDWICLLVYDLSLKWWVVLLFVIVTNSGEMKLMWEKEWQERQKEIQKRISSLTCQLLVECQVYKVEKTVFLLKPSFKELGTTMR